MAVTRTLTFKPAVRPAAARTSTTRPTTTGSRARTPAPTKRTTAKPRQVSSPDIQAQLATIRRPSGPLKPLVPLTHPDDGPPGIFEQLKDLVVGLPQGLVGFGKEAITDTIAVPRAIVDLAKDQKLRGIEDYVPGISGVVKSFGHTGADIVHPQNFIDAYNEGHIVGKIVEDVGNVAIVGGALAKGLGAGASTAVMSAEEAGALGARATGRTVAEAAGSGVRLTPGAEAAQRVSGSIADAAQFGGRELAEYSLPKRGLAGVAEKAGAEGTAGRLQQAGNVVRSVSHLGERAGNVPIAPYQWAGRGINRLAEAAGMEGGITGAAQRLGGRVAPGIMFRSSEVGQVVRTAQAETERVGTRATRYSLGADDLANRLKLTDVERTAVLDSIDRPNLGMGLEHLDDAQLEEYLNGAYPGVEADLRPTLETVRKQMQYRDRTLPPEMLSRLDQVRDELVAISQDRTVRARGPAPTKLEPGTPAEPTAPGTVYRGGEPPGVVPGRPIVGDTPRGLHPEQELNQIRETKVAEYQQTLERPRNLAQRRWTTAENTALREERIQGAIEAINDMLPEAPSPRIAFNQGRQFENVRVGDSVARRRYEVSQRQLDAALRDYVKVADGPPSPAVEAAAKEVDRLTLEVTRVKEMVERNERRVDAAQGLSRASGQIEAGAPRIEGQTPGDYAFAQAEAKMEATLSELQALNELHGHPQVPRPEIVDVGGQPQMIRARAKAVAQEAAYEAEGVIDSLASGDRPKLPTKGMAGGEYDWFYGLDAPTRRRLQREGWMRASEGNAGSRPDVITETMNRNLGTNMSTDQAMGRWVDAVRRYWDTKAGKSIEVIDRVVAETGLTHEQVTAAVRGRIADYGPLLTEPVNAAFDELRGSYQALPADQSLSFNATIDGIIADPSGYTTADFAEILQNYLPDIDAEAIMSVVDGMADIPEVIDWMRGGRATEFPERLRAKIAERGDAQSRQLGKLEGQAQGTRSLAATMQGELRRSEGVLAAVKRAEEKSSRRGVTRAARAADEAIPVQGPKLAETLRPDTAAYDPYRRRNGARVSPADRARIREGVQRERAMKARTTANRLRRSVDRYNDRIASARDELSRTVQERLNADVNVPAVKQLRNAIASGGKPLGNLVGSGDTAAINGVIGDIGRRYELYDDLVISLDDARSDKANAAMAEADLDGVTADVKPQPLTAGEVAQVVDNVLRARPDVVLEGPDRTLLDDAIGRDTLLDDMDMTMLDETDGGRRLNSPYRVKDVIDAHAWNMPQESRNRVQAAWERWQVRRAKVIAETYNQYSAAVPAKWRPMVQEGHRQIGSLLEMAEAKNKRAPGDGDIYLDMAELTGSTLSQMVEAGFVPEHLIGGRPAPQSSAASTAYGGGLTSPKLRGESVRRSGLRQQTSEAYARVEAKEALDWIKRKRNEYLEAQLGVRANAVPEVQTALAEWADAHPGETMPPRTLSKITEDAGYKPIGNTDVTPSTTLIPKQVFDLLGTDQYKHWTLTALGRTNRAFKTWVLPFSPKWQIGNILGNVIQAAVHGGVTPVELVRTMNRIRKHEGGIGNLWREAGLPGWSRAEIANHGLTIDEYRTYRGLEDKPPRTPIGKVARASFRLNEFVDNLTRSAVDLAALARGESSDAALQTTVRSLGDYSRMTNFERKIIREVLPFYAWIRHSTIATLRLPITSPTRAAFLLHLADVYKDPEEQGELFGSRLPMFGGLFNLGTINPLADAQSMTLGGLVGPALSPAIKGISSIGFGLDLNKMKAITRPDDTGQLDAYGKPKTTSPLTQLFRDPAAGIGEIGWQLSQQGPAAIKNLRDYALGDDARYSGTGYRVGTLQDPSNRSISTLLRALNLPTIDPLPNER